MNLVSRALYALVNLLLDDISALGRSKINCNRWEDLNIRSSNDCSLICNYREINYV